MIRLSFLAVLLMLRAVADQGRPPFSLFLDEHHENVAAYRLKARLVFDKLVALGILPPQQDDKKE